MITASALGNEGRPRWQVRLFGGFDLSLLPGGERVTSLGKRERILLAYLALSPKNREQRRKLTTLLWGDAADETTLENLRVCLYGLRKALGDVEHRVIASESEEIVLEPAAFEIDALAFRRLVAQSGREELEEAARLYRGGLLEGLDIESEEFESWRRSEAARCQEQAIDALHRLMMQLSEAGDGRRAIQAGERIMMLDPMDEGAVRLLMRLHAGSGRRSVAIQLYRTLSGALKADLNAQPEAETRAIFAEITRGGEELAPPATATAAPVAPTITARRPEPAHARPGPPIPEVRRSRWGGQNWIVASALAAAMALVLAYALIPRGTAEPTQAGAIAVAVLPFDNLSSDPEQQFFSEGITEEITSALARIPDLGVVARTSASQFKGQDRNIQEIARALNATHLIEGSVRKAGDRVRITAQLIQADDGLHVWTSSYERELTDIFAIQEEIALAIAGALRMPLGLAPGQSLIANRNIDPVSYEQYLSARALIRSRINQPDAVARRIAAIAVLEQVVARHPEYAPAWATLSLGYFRRGIANPGNRTVLETRRSVDEWLPKAEAAARHANELDPNLADGYSQLAVTMAIKGELIQAEELYSKALALDPFHPETMHFYAILLGAAGRVKEAIAMREKVKALDPLIGVYNSNYEEMLWADGQSETLLASPYLSQAPPGFLARIYWSQRRYSEAADVVLTIPPQSDPEGTAQIAERLLRNGPGASVSAESLPRFGNSLDGLDFVYLHVGAPELVLQAYEDNNAAGSPQLVAMVFLWHPAYAPVRKTERFKAYVRAINLDDYWRAKGWPVFCRPAGADDFTCS